HAAVAILPIAVRQGAIDAVLLLPCPQCQPGTPVCAGCDHVPSAVCIGEAAYHVSARISRDGGMVGGAKESDRLHRRWNWNHKDIVNRHDQAVRARTLTAPLQGSSHGFVGIRLSAVERKVSDGDGEGLWAARRRVALLDLRQIAGPQERDLL